MCVREREGMKIGDEIRIWYDREDFVGTYMKACGSGVCWADKLKTIKLALHEHFIGISKWRNEGTVREQNKVSGTEKKRERAYIHLK